MTNSTPNIPILNDDAVAELEAIMASGDSQAMYEAANIDNVRSLCATVRVLRAENERLIERLAQEVAGRVNTNAERLEGSQRFTQSEINDHCSDDRLTDEQRGSYQG